MVDGDFLDSARRVCRHEFGHHVIARVAGFKAGIVRVKVEAGGAEHVASALIVPTEPLHSFQDVTAYLRRRIVVLLAGACAESLSDQSMKVDLRRAGRVLAESGFLDGEKALELSTALYGCEFADILSSNAVEGLLGPSTLRDGLLKVTSGLVELHADIIDQLSDELLADIKPGREASLDARVLDAHPLLASIRPARF